MHRELKILVVDDERPARNRLMRMLEQIPDATAIGEAENGNMALAQIAKLSPDVILLDVDMPGLDGIALAEKGDLPPIIFTTAHVQFAADAFDLEAVDYLIKPVRQDRLERALDRARRRMLEKPRLPSHELAIHAGNAVRFVDARRVTAFRAADKYTAFTLDGEEQLVRESLDTLEAQLVELGFIRVHRAGLIRRDAVVSLESEKGTLMVHLIDGVSVEVSRRNAPALRRLLGLRR